MTELSPNQKVRAALVRVLGDDKAAFAAQSGDIVGEGHLDSFALIELTAELEASFGIVIPTEQIGGPAYCNVETLERFCIARQ